MVGSGESLSTRLIAVFRFLVCVCGEWRVREVAGGFTDYMKSCRGCVCVCGNGREGGEEGEGD